MKYKKFKEKKKEFDNKASLYFMNRAFSDLKDTDAYKEKLIDGVGNVISKSTLDNNWALTSFDKIILLLKQTLGADKLKGLLGNFEWVKMLDPLYLINMKGTPNFKSLIDGWKSIITKIEDATFLPELVQRTNNDTINTSFVESEFSDKLSFALTSATLLLYTFINDKMPNSIDFTHNIMPSVETTFWITASNDYSGCIKYLKENELLDHYDKVTNKGLRMLVSISKDLITNGLMNSVIDREENKYKIWERLSQR